jgi:hypothetical protein
MDPHSTVELQDGTVLQAGIPTYEEGLPRWDSTSGWIARAVVLKTYFTDDSGWSERGWTASGVRAIHCDVRVFGRQNRTLYRVPVMQRTHGLFDEDVYIPRPSAQNISGGSLVTKPSSGSTVTTAQDLDGDHVLIGFLECDPRQPVIFPFCLAHPQARKKYKESDGHVRRIRHNGVLMEWDADGNWTLDATEAAKADFAAEGEEASNSGTAGKITIKTVDGSSDESSIALDESGGILLSDAASDTITFTKADKLIAIDAGTKITITAGAQLELEGPATKITASTSLQATAPTTSFSASGTFGVTSPAVTFTAATSFLVTSLSVTLGSAAAVPVVKHTPWATMWASLDSELKSQVKKYTGPPVPSTVSVGDYLKMLTKLQAVSTAFTTVMSLLVKVT